MKTAEFQLETLSCPTCVKKIEGTLGRMSGIKGSRVLFNSSKVKLTLDESKVKAEDVVATMNKIGYEVISHKVS